MQIPFNCRQYGVHPRVPRLAPTQTIPSQTLSPNTKAPSLGSQAPVLNTHHTQRAKQRMLGKTVILGLWSCSPACCFLHIKDLALPGGCLIFGLSSFFSPTHPDSLLKYSYLVPPSAEIKASTPNLLLPLLYLMLYRHTYHI